jgi:hypothetical protein
MQLGDQCVHLRIACRKINAAHQWLSALKPETQHFPIVQGRAERNPLHFVLFRLNQMPEKPTLGCMRPGRQRIKTRRIWAGGEVRSRTGSSAVSAPAAIAVSNPDSKHIVQDLRPADVPLIEAHIHRLSGGYEGDFPQSDDAQLTHLNPHAQAHVPGCRWRRIREQPVMDPRGNSFKGPFTAMFTT